MTPRLRLPELRSGCAVLLLAAAELRSRLNSFSMGHGCADSGVRGGGGLGMEAGMNADDIGTVLDWLTDRITELDDLIDDCFQKGNTGCADAANFLVRILESERRLLNAKLLALTAAQETPGAEKDDIR
jgi:hypothetical protein